MQYRSLAEDIASTIEDQRLCCECRSNNKKLLLKTATSLIEDILEDYFRFQEEDKANFLFGQ